MKNPKLNHKDVVRFDDQQWTVMRHLNAEETVIIHDTHQVLAVPVDDVELVYRYGTEKSPVIKKMATLAMLAEIHRELMEL